MWDGNTMMFKKVWFQLDGYLDPTFMDGIVNKESVFFAKESGFCLYLRKTCLDFIVAGLYMSIFHIMDEIR